MTCGVPLAWTAAKASRPGGGGGGASVVVVVVLVVSTTSEVSSTAGAAVAAALGSGATGAAASTVSVVDPHAEATNATVAPRSTSERRMQNIVTRNRFTCLAAKFEASVAPPATQPSNLCAISCKT